MAARYQQLAPRVHLPVSLKAGQGLLGFTLGLPFLPSLPLPLPLPFWLNGLGLRGFPPLPALGLRPVASTLAAAAFTCLAEREYPKGWPPFSLFFIFVACKTLLSSQVLIGLVLLVATVLGAFAIRCGTGIGEANQLALSLA